MTVDSLTRELALRTGQEVNVHFDADEGASSAPDAMPWTVEFMHAGIEHNFGGFEVHDALQWALDFVAGKVGDDGRPVLVPTSSPVRRGLTDVELDLVSLARELQVDDRCNLFGDRYADPFSENVVLECEYAVVENVQVRPAEVLVDFDKGSYIFPLDHPVRINIEPKG